VASGIPYDGYLGSQLTEIIETHRPRPQAAHHVRACSAVQTDTPTGIDQSLAVGLSDLINND
jgi:hypothetical protein